LGVLYLIRVNHFWLIGKKAMLSKTQQDSTEMVSLSFVYLQ